MDSKVLIHKMSTAKVSAVQDFQRCFSPGNCLLTPMYKLNHFPTQFLTKDHSFLLVVFAMETPDLNLNLFIVQSSGNHTMILCPC